MAQCPKTRAVRRNHLNVVPDEAEVAHTSDGDCFPPARKSLFWFWVLLAFGAVLIAASLVALNLDPAAVAYPVPKEFLPVFRVYMEKVVLICGSGCAVTALVCLRNHQKGLKIERDTDRKTRSMERKRVEKLKPETVGFSIGSYILAMIGFI